MFCCYTALPVHIVEVLWQLHFGMFEHLVCGSLRDALRGHQFASDREVKESVHVRLPTQQNKEKKEKNLFHTEACSLLD
jgi:hypothetical protein